MKSHINLLHKEFRPKFVWVCSEHFVLLVIFSIVICLAAYAGATSYKTNQQSVVDELRNRLATTQNTTTELTLNLEQRVSDPILKNQLESLKQISQSKSVLVNHIRELSTVKQHSFSSLMSSLSHASSDNLWLTGFEYKSDVISLNGKMVSPSALPLWISKLSDTKYFKGQEFGQASVEKLDGELTFKLTSFVANEKLIAANNSKTKEVSGGVQ